VSLVKVLTDPAAGVQLARLRDKDTPPDRFRAYARSLASMLTMEAVRDIPVESGEVEGPLGPAPMRRPAPPVVAVPVLRAGLGLLQGLHDVIPTAYVGMIGLQRNEQTLEPESYYFKVPDLTDAWVLVLEPMLATGGSASQAVTALHPEGAAQVTVLSVVATQQAIDRIHEHNPGTRIVVGAIDRGLDDNGYIVPGLGDFGDRLFGTLD
jgi:uracil phosphoribosyltransferase